MLSSKCTHLRVRDKNDYDFDVQQFLESIEREYQIDFREFPGWKDLVQRLHVSTTDYRRKIQDAYLRKALIIDKLHMQMTRPSPFELTAGLCRTANKWRKKIENKRSSEVTTITEEEKVHMSKTDASNDGLSESPHPNTEIFSSESYLAIPFVEKEKVDAEVPEELPANNTYRLPIFICTNMHKLISLPDKEFSGFTGQSIDQISEMDARKESIPSEKGEWMIFKPTSSVISTPKEVLITNDTLKQQSVQFSITNCTTEYMHIRFRTIIDSSPFIKTKLLPIVPKKIYPGIAVVYKFIFKLKNQEDFKSGLYFKLGYDVCDNRPPEGLCVPIASAFRIERSVTVSDPISIPPIYPWHIKRNSTYSTGTVKISVNDPYTYHLHIYKRTVDFATDPEGLLSLKASGPNTASVAGRTTDTDDIRTIASSKSLKSIKSTKSLHKIKSQKSVKSVKNFDIMLLLAEDIVDLALQSFIFESTYLFLSPYSKVTIPVYFIEAERSGYHQSYYDFEFIDPETNQVIFTKTSRVFAEILANPIQVSPVILDMSTSPVTHGYSEDSFVVSNSHKLYPVTVRIKLTTKMKKMFYVEPMETLVPTSSSVTFWVKFCSRDFLSVHPSDDLVHFTFKIIVTGYKPVYENVPPIFYEVIAPCAVEFKKVYNEKYFKAV